MVHDLIAHQVSNHGDFGVLACFIYFEYLDDQIVDVGEVLSCYVVFGPELISIVRVMLSALFDENLLCCRNLISDPYLVDRGRDKLGRHFFFLLCETITLFGLKKS